MKPAYDSDIKPAAPQGKPSDPVPHTWVPSPSRTGCVVTPACGRPAGGPGVGGRGGAGPRGHHRRQRAGHLRGPAGVQGGGRLAPTESKLIFAGGRKRRAVADQLMSKWGTRCEGLNGLVSSCDPESQDAAVEECWTVWATIFTISVFAIRANYDQTTDMNSMQYTIMSRSCQFNCSRLVPVLQLHAAASTHTT